MKTDSFLTLTIFFLINLIMDFLINRVRVNQISNSKNCLGFVSCINGKLPVEGSIGTIIYRKCQWCRRHHEKFEKNTTNYKKVLEHRF